MAGAPGFVMPQAVPSSQQVGMALMQQQAAPAAAPPMMEMPSSQEASVMEGKMLRQAGGLKTGAAGQVDDHDEDDGMGHSPNAVNIAVGEALTRLGGGQKSNPNPHKNREAHMRQLMQLGLSATEAELMVATGGV